MATVKDIQNALDEVKEYLILNKYNDAMMLMAQITIETIEYIVDDNLIVSKGYEEDLKTILQSNLIEENTCHNFEALIISGVQANKGVSIPKEYANQSYEVLANEIKNLFVKDKEEDTEEKSPGEIKEVSKQNQVFSFDEEDDTPAFMSKEDNADFRKRERERQLNYTKSIKKIPQLKKLIVLIIPIVLLIIIALLIKGCLDGFANNNNAVPTVESTEDIIFTETETTTEEQTTSFAGFYRITGDIVNLRAEANSQSRIIARVSKGETVQVTGQYDNSWAIVRYNGRDAFVSRQYIERVEDQTIAPEYNE